MKSKILKELVEKRVEILNEYESRNVLAEYGIPCPKEVMISYEDGKGAEEYLKDAKRTMEFPGYPAFFKVVSRDIKSKTDAGTVKRVLSDEEAKVALEQIIRNAKEYKEGVKIQGILISEDCSSPEMRELFLGATVNEHFGHIISLGFGGIYVEVYKDVEFRVVPIGEVDVYDMVKRLKAKDILGPFRGMKPVNMSLLVVIMLKLSKMIEENPEIVEMDVNPLLISSERAVAVDTKIRVHVP
ncbi:MAG: acetate--CoA ligase family protein [Candidatus Brockarchaeota archaeon]|nr:acetate--CoA ligase family protein [Candidatus Brockarchaeota archaeon]